MIELEAQVEFSIKRNITKELDEKSWIDFDKALWDYIYGNVSRNMENAIREQFLIWQRELQMDPVSLWVREKELMTNLSSSLTP